jgi:hypothetical protein
MNDDDAKKSSQVVLMLRIDFEIKSAKSIVFELFLMFFCVIRDVDRTLRDKVSREI